MERSIQKQVAFCEYLILSDMSKCTKTMLIYTLELQKM